MNTKVLKKSRRGWTHLSVRYRMCIWGRQSLGSWVFGARVRECFVRRANRTRTSAEHFSADWRPFASIGGKKRRYRI